MRVVVLLALFTCSLSISTRDAKAKKGKLFVYGLHSATLFNHTVPVKWSATLKDKPALPQWLHLLPSRHPPLAYLIGTPVTSMSQIIVHVIAKRTDTFQSAQQYVVIDLAEDERYTKSTTQILNILVKNYDAEELITDRTGLIGRLESAADESFKGKLVNSYIYNIQPAINADAQQYFIGKKAGSIVSLGTQRGFYPKVNLMVNNIRTGALNCRKPNLVPINKFFTPSFNVDWCSTTLQNVTQIQKLNGENNGEDEPTMAAIETSVPEKPPGKISGDGGFSFTQSVFLFPFIAVVCIVLILVLTLIFFGWREGQHWRDYKTPRHQLEEFVSVRASQRHLRELSVQRQLLLMSDERDQSNAPSGIHSFLQPKVRSTTSRSGSARFSKSASRLNEEPGEETVSIGRQTVAEAARQCGSSLHLYRNPLQSESEEESEASDQAASG